MQNASGESGMWLHVLCLRNQKKCPLLKKPVAGHRLTYRGVFILRCRVENLFQNGGLTIMLSNELFQLDHVLGYFSGC